MKPILSKSRFAVILAIFAPLAHAEEWKVTYPRQFREVEWLKTHQRACFGVDDKKIAETMADGVNVLIGGTNAGGPNTSPP